MCGSGGGLLVGGGLCVGSVDLPETQKHISRPTMGGKGGSFFMQFFLEPIGRIPALLLS